MMSQQRVRRTLALASLSLLAISFPSHAEEPTVEMVRFRPFSFLKRDRSDEREEERDEKENSLQEPISAPPASRYRRSVSSSSQSGEQTDPLLQLTERAIEKSGHRILDANQHRPWQIIHGLLALRRDFVLRDGRRAVNAIDWISDAARFKGQYWFEATGHGGRAQPYNGTPFEFEGHVNQTLALMSLSNLPLSHEFKVAAGRTVTMADMVKHAQMTVNTREEITWTFWFLTHYLDIDTEWTNADGEPWSLEELARLQTEAKVIGTPCGGTHGLFALAYARNAYLYKHGRLRGVWFEADQKIKRHIELAKALQNSDGSFATEYFKGPGHSRDFNERLKASGHMLEWLMMALPHSRLNESWVRRAVASVATDLVHYSSRPAECGPLYHAVHSLVLYRDRMATTKAPETIAEKPGEAKPLSAEAPVNSESEAELIPTTPVMADANGKAHKSKANDTPQKVVQEPADAAGPILMPPLEGPLLEPVHIDVDPDDVRPIQ